MSRSLKSLTPDGLMLSADRLASGSMPTGDAAGIEIPASTSGEPLISAAFQMSDAFSKSPLPSALSPTSNSQRTSSTLRGAGVRGRLRGLSRGGRQFQRPPQYANNNINDNGGSDSASQQQQQQQQQQQRGGASPVVTSLSALNGASGPRLSLRPGEGAPHQSGSSVHHFSRLLSDSSSSDDGSDDGGASSGSEEEVGAHHTYTELLSRGVDGALRVGFGAQTAKELVALIAERRVAIGAAYAAAQAEAGRALKARKDASNALYAGLNDAVVNTLPSDGDAAVYHAPISVRQLPSWRVAMQRNRDRTAGALGGGIDEGGDTFFTTMPLQYNDFAESDQSGQPVYATAQQLKDDALINFMQRYYVWVMLLFTVMHIVYYSMVTFRCGFSVPYTDWVEYALEWAILDIPMAIFAFVTDVLPREYKGVYKVQTRVEAAKYIRSVSFVSDVIGVLPLDIVGFAIGSKCSLTDTMQCGFLAPYWKLNRILLARYAAFNTGDLMEAVTLSTGYPPQLSRLLLTLIYLMLLAHTAACVLNIYLETNPTLNIIWTDDTLYPHRTLSDKYFQSMDWSTKSLMGLWKGFNFNLPLESIIFVLILAIAGTILLSAFVGIITSLLFRSSPYEVATQSINLLYDEFANKQLPDDLRERTRAYYWHLYETMGKKDVVMDALVGLPKQLQVQLTLQVGRDMLGKVPLLAAEAQNNEFVLALTVALVPQIIHPFSIIFKKGDRGDSMAFVTAGSVAVVPTTFITTHDVDNIYFLLKTGSFFGEIALILGVPRTATIATLNRFANLLVLGEDTFRQIAADFPSAVRRMRLEAECRLAALNQGPEALNRERARRLLEAINISRMRYAFVQWVDGCRQRMLWAAMDTAAGGGGVGDMGVGASVHSDHVMDSSRRRSSHFGSSVRGSHRHYASRGNGMALYRALLSEAQSNTMEEDTVMIGPAR